MQVSNSGHISVCRFAGNFEIFAKTGTPVCRFTGDFSEIVNQKIRFAGNFELFGETGIPVCRLYLTETPKPTTWGPHGYTENTEIYTNVVGVILTNISH